MPASRYREYIYDNKKMLLRNVITPKHIAQYAKALSNNKKDVPIMISGYPGEGKSVLAKRICELYDRRYSDDRNCIYSRKELMEKIETYPPSGFNIDEAINVLYSRDWNVGTQKELVKVLNICRSKKHLIIFIQPEFTDLDTKIRNSRIRLWIFVIKRGIAAVFKPERTLSGGNDPWNLVENNALVKQYINVFNGDVVRGTVEGCFRSKNFLAFLRWDDIPKEEYEAYEEVKDKKKYEDYKEDNLMTAEMARKESVRMIYEVCALLEADGKLKKGWNNSIVVPYLKISTTAGSSYIKRARIALNLIKDKSDNTAVDIDKLEPVHIS